ncbi:hypothetical protein C8C88_0272 [Flavobacterium sp. 123]|nr:hypothetical protein C8C88_0272 [Flavobacterium sp. 123]
MILIISSIYQGNYLFPDANLLTFILVKNLILVFLTVLRSNY